MGDQEDKLDKLYDKMQKLETLLEKMINDGKANIVNVEKIDIQGPILDKLEFTFDKIDIDEVSGALNLGNNLGVRVNGTDENKKAKPSDKQMKSKPSAPTGNEQTTKSDGKNETDKTKFSDIEKQIEEKLKEIFPKNINQQESNAQSDQQPAKNKHSKQSSVQKNLKSTEDLNIHTTSQTEEKPNQESKEMINENQQKERALSADKPKRKSTYSNYTHPDNKKSESSTKTIRKNKEMNQMVEKDLRMTNTTAGFSFRFTDKK